MVVHVEYRSLGPCVIGVVFDCAQTDVGYFVLFQLQAENLHLCCCSYLVESVFSVLLVELLGDFAGVLEK